MIIVTGAKGFIGGALSRRLQSMDYDVIEVDFWKNTHEGLHTDRLIQFIAQNHGEIEFIFHMGACADTMETDPVKMFKLNFDYPQALWISATMNKIPIIYASSAATYGLGEKGYLDNHTLSYELKPLNIYGQSKNEFDKFVLSTHAHPPFWAGLKFFNVYGHNESHKGKMASMVYHGYNQIRDTGKIRLFKSGEHERDFIYIKDIINTCIWMMFTTPESGIYNVGTGKARSFNDLALAIFNNMNKEPNIEYFDMPEDMIGKYQPFTQADVTKLAKLGFSDKFRTLEEGVADYIKILQYEDHNKSILTEA